MEEKIVELSQDENEFLRLILSGETYKSLSIRNGITVDKLKNKAFYISRKFGCRARSGLFALAYIKLKFKCEGKIHQLQLRAHEIIDNEEWF